MSKNGTTAALIVAAGKGERTGGSIPKQYIKIADKALVTHAVDGFSEHSGIGGIFIVIADGQQDILADALGDRKIAAVIPGGALRQDSVRAGLERIANAQAFDSVLIHDAARPFLPKAVLDRLIAALASHEGAVPVLPIVDTLAHDDGHQEIPERDIPAQEEHGDDDDEGGVDQFLVFLRAFLLRLPRPRRLGEFAPDLAGEVANMSPVSDERADPGKAGHPHKDGGDPTAADHK